MNDDHFQLPDAARAAFESYPHLEPSAAFNRAVLQRLELESQRRSSTLIGRLEEFLGLDLWRFAASGLLGAFLPALILGALYLSNSAVQPSKQFPDPPQTAMRALGPFYAREWELTAGLAQPPAAKLQPSKPANHPKGSEISCVDSMSHLA